MSTHNILNPRQKQQLQQALRESNNPDLREGCLILLLLNDGRTAREITNLLGCSYRSVAYWQLQGVPNNLESITDTEKLGNFGNADKLKSFPNNGQLRSFHKKQEDFISLSQIRILEDTFACVKQYEIKFAASFYQNLFTDYPQIQPLFAYVAMETQHKKLIMALVLIINNLRNLSYLKTILKDLGERHVRYGTIPEYYPLLAVSLFKTLEFYLGDDWTPEVSQAWADGYKAIVQLMLAGHEENQSNGIE
jgi:hemoglobin-like flavoprotein